MVPPSSREETRCSSACETSVIVRAPESEPVYVGVPQGNLSLDHVYFFTVCAIQELRDRNRSSVLVDRAAPDSSDTVVAGSGSMQSSLSGVYIR